MKKATLLFLSLVLVISCKPKKNENESAVTEVTIGCSRLRISLPVFVACHNNYFGENGLDVTIEMFDTAQPLMDALCGGKIDVAGYTALPITFNAQIKSRKELLYTTLLMEDDAHPISLFMVPPDSSIETFVDMKGKTIGILPTFAYKAWLDMIMKNNGLGPDDYIVQQVAPAMTPSTLGAGTVDVMFTNDPAVTTSIRQGAARLLFDKAVVPEYMWSPLPFASFNISREFAEKNPGTTEKIVRSLNRAIVFIEGHQDEAKTIMAEFLPEAQKPFVGFYPDALFVESDKVDFTGIDKIQKAYNDLGIIPENLELNDLLYK